MTCSIARVIRLVYQYTVKICDQNLQNGTDCTHFAVNIYKKLDVFHRRYFLIDFIYCQNNNSFYRIFQVHIQKSQFPS